MEPKETAINPDFLKPYSPKDNEEALYKQWEESGYFNPDVCVAKGVAAADAETFSIVLPPPNVTGVLHMGHAAMLAVEDILVRYNRMLGKRTLWIPGTDSAAIATQSKVEGEIYKKEKKNRHDIGREELLKRVTEFAENSKDTIISQTKSMGSSLDWSRYAYTLDEKRYKAVMEAFVRMYNAGLIYRGERIVNWDPKGQTTISDDEIVHEERHEKFYYLKYGPFVIGTSRPETKFGDKYVVMHPEDARYKEYTQGQMIELEWINGPITATVIKDEAIDMEFGTGVMTITPWHDATDFDIANRHNLEKEQVIDERGILLPIAGEFAGQHIKKARENIIEKLRAKGLLDHEEAYTHNVSTAERTSEVIEPQIKAQWFIAVTKKVEFPDGRVMTLKERMREAVESGAIKIAPERFDKTYYHWIDNLRDWNISRQIWFGHRIPAWFKDDEVKVQLETPGEGWEQDPDTLDTWFSSGLWTFSTLGWPEETKDMRTYHSTSVLETGYDILFFWVARMILMSTFLVGEVPFKNVYLHGMVRDGKGQKMSKSKGNIIDPLDMITKYGADATRLSLIVGAAPGNDVPLSEDKIRGYKNFANKLWNISRFVLSNSGEVTATTEVKLSARDQEILDGFYAVSKEVGGDIEKFGLYLAAEKAYHYVWDELAAKIIEESKPILNGDDLEAKQARQQVLIECLTGSLKLLHPFMPFVTEAVWQRLPPEMKESEFLMISKWPAPRN